MTATYNLVTIGATEYDVYSDLGTADIYLEAESWATAWRAEADNDVKSRATVTATRTLDKLVWPGTRTYAEQEREWPRKDTGLSTDLVADDNTIPQRLIDAASVLAGLDVAGVDFTSVISTQASVVKMQKAGSVAIEYFRDIVNLDGTRLPLAAWELIAPLFGAGGSVLGGAVSYGTDTCSRFTESNRPLGGYAAS